MREIRGFERTSGPKIDRYDDDVRGHDGFVDDKCPPSSTQKQLPKETDSNDRKRERRQDQNWLSTGTRCGPEPVPR